MTDEQFLALADRTLAQIEDGIDALDADIDADRAGNVLSFELSDRSKIIINTQAPTANRISVADGMSETTEGAGRDIESVGEAGDEAI